MWGKAIPAGSMDTIVDAEMYAILLYLRKMTTGSEEDVQKRRCLVLSDCQPALKAIETAWRRGRITTGREGDRGAMLEEICERRSRINRLITVWTPSHRGISPNSVADAIAKAYLEKEVDTEGVNSIASVSKTRPCVYGIKTPTGIEMRDRRIYKEAHNRTKKWTCKKLQETTTNGIMLKHDTDHWKGVAKKVGLGDILEEDGEAIV